MSSSSELFEWDESPGFFDKHWQNMPEFKQADRSAQRQIIVSFDNDDDVQTFAKLIGQNITDKTKSVWFPQREKQIVKELFWIEEDK
jgi:hypothetical protein